MSASAAGKRWAEIAREFQPELPGTWETIGAGTHTTLIRTPIRWTVSFINFGQSSGGWGSLGAARRTLVVPFPGWGLRFGTSTANTRQTRKMWKITDPDAPDIVRTFVFQHGLPAIDEWPEDRLAGTVARLTPPIDRPNLPYWTMGPGFAVVSGACSPVPAAQACIDFAPEMAWEPDYVQFYVDIIGAWESGGRAAALSFLTQHRAGQLADIGISASSLSAR